MENILDDATHHANLKLLKTYRELLPLDKEHMDDELEKQAEVQQRIAMQVVEYNTAALDAKEALKLAEADVSIRLRRDADTRVTDKQVESEAARDPERQAAFQRLQKFRAYHEHWSSLLDSWRQRGYSLKTLADLYAAQYFTIDSTYRGRVDEGRRQSMREASERVDARRREEGAPVVEYAPTERPRRRVVS